MQKISHIGPQLRAKLWLHEQPYIASMLESCSILMKFGVSVILLEQIIHAKNQYGGTSIAMTMICELLQKKFSFFDFPVFESFFAWIDLGC